LICIASVPVKKKNMRTLPGSADVDTRASEEAEKRKSRRRREMKRERKKSREREASQQSGVSTICFHHLFCNVGPVVKLHKGRCTVTGATQMCNKSSLQS